MPKYIRVEDIKKVCNPYKDEDVPVFEIVFCRECFFFAEAKVNTNGFLICPASGMEITEQDYCSYGERREDGDNH